MENIMECQTEFQTESSTMEGLFTMVYPQVRDLPPQYTSPPPPALEPLSEHPGLEQGPGTELGRQGSLTSHLINTAFTRDLTARQGATGLL